MDDAADVDDDADVENPDADVDKNEYVDDNADVNDGYAADDDADVDDDAPRSVATWLAPAQVDALTTLLNATAPHYIRCIKPNGRKAAASFNGGMVLQQLQYSGALESIHIRRAGYSARFLYPAFGT
eukprot:9288606-Pyramimonas_sp.AAC.1